MSKEPEKELNEEMFIEIFKALSDKTRLNMIMELLNGERQCSELITKFNLCKSTFSHHAKILSKCGLVKYRKEGKYLFFRLDFDVFRNIQGLFKKADVHLI